MVEYDATENSVLSLDDIKAILIANARLHEAAIHSSQAIDAVHRRAFLSGWARTRSWIAEAQTFEDLCELVGFKRLGNEHWFSGKGRSGRREFFAIAIPVAAWTLVFVGWQLAIGYRPATLWEALVGMAALMLPLALGFFAACRRVHDLGYGGYLLVLPLLVGLLADWLTAWLTGSHAFAQWASFAGCIAIVLAIGALPGSPKENHYGLPPPRP